MRPEAGSGILVTARELEARLSQELAVTDWRAVLAVVVAAPGLEHDAEQACRNAIEAAGIDLGLVVELAVSRDEASTRQLESINRARDTLLPAKRLVLLRAAHAADVRFLRQTAPDLVSATDLFVELVRSPVAGPQADWPTCREHIRALMEERHSVLDFTGLLTAGVGQRSLPLPALYQPLVPLQPTNPEHSTRRKDGLMVMGHPGTGKTTFLRFLAWTYSYHSSDPLGIGPKVPVLLSLSDYGHDREHDRVRSLIEFLPVWLARQDVVDASSIAEHLPEVLLLLDDLDEMRVPESRHAVLAEVSQLLREERVGGVVVAGRSFLVEDLPRPDHPLRQVATQEPTLPQIEAFLTAFVRMCRDDRFSAQRAHRLVSRIIGDPDRRALARTPLMLGFMAVLDELEGRVPDRRIEIYFRLGELLIDRWSHGRSTHTTPTLQVLPSRTEARRLLGSLAWSAVDRGGSTISELGLSQELERLERSQEPHDDAKARANVVLKSLRENTGALVSQPGGRWGFIHGSIGAYFAGVEAANDETRWSALLREPFRPEWREIVLFCAGQLGVISGRMDRLGALVRTVLTRSRHGSREDMRYPSLLIGLLEEIPEWDRRLIDEVMKELLALLTGVVYPSPVAGWVRREFLSLLLKARRRISDSFEVQLPLFGAMRRSDTDWIFRLAEWQRHSGSLAHQRTVGEVAHDLELDR